MENFIIEGLSFSLDLSKPIYEQILQQFRSAIARGEISLGSKIPSVRELAQTLKVNPNTVMRAYQELERDGLTETRRGQGTFITAYSNRVDEIKHTLALEAVKEFIAAMNSLGMDKASAIKIFEEVGDLDTRSRDK